MREFWSLVTKPKSYWCDSCKRYVTGAHYCPGPSNSETMGE